ncbi:LLM class flavin-dependent oxidoreductase [Endozoicomonas gorgoniicola]|uniref:LLM class flavin-dependent oxidoreductase n=1 Tax=Endozoicomonas gorgoniicola TaxID=1234144 RepID=A0ABT3MVC4_9GAMM|nr:LLM class flavin-dependent oxidoreductase [Endozoicomonas gorgoniicola]MCW7552929.1 LLM class flavin-dependent oxidoreductase [Endozoicomonas gorgoniicola]
MKFSLFLHMERYNHDKPHQELLDELVELVQIAEAGGFDKVWIGEHHAMEFTIGPNPFSFLAYLASLTKNIRLGVGTAVAPFWHPIKLAGEAALVDVMSNGRLEFGIARGAYQCEFDRLLDGKPAAEGAKYLREMVPALQKLWAGDYEHKGECWSFPTSTAVPKPLNSSSIPMWLAARTPESHDYAIKSGCNVMVTPLFKNDDEVVSLMNKFETACADNPGVKRPEIMCLRHTYVHEQPEDWKVGVNGIRNWYAHFQGWARNNQVPEAGFCSPINEDELNEMPDFAPEVLRENLVIGTPGQVVKRLKNYEKLGLDEYSFWSDNSLSHEEKKKSLELFIKEVVPSFQ